MTRLRLTMVLGTLPWAASADASAPAAWDEHYRSVVHDCLAASGLRRARAEGDLMLFSDEIGTALLVRGRKPGAKKDMLVLCVFRRGAGTVEVQPVHDGVKVPAPAR